MEIEPLRIKKAPPLSAQAQGVLFRFTDRLYRARSLSEVYDAALDAIADGLGCSRASILRFDVEGVMRFVAWRGLSEKYRLAVDGHSPWRPGDHDANPVCIEDIELTDESERLKSTIRKEGIRGLAFIPLTIDGLVIGKFMAYYRTPHSFTDQEIALALTVARQLGFSIARRLADDDARRLISIVESSEDAILAKDLHGVITNWNEGAERLFGYQQHEAIGKPGAMLIPPDRRDEEPLIIGRIRSGERINHYETVRQRKDGSLVDISLTVSPIKDAAGNIIGVSKIARDITERRRAQEEQLLLLREMDHRIKNLFAVASSIVALSAQNAPSVAALASSVRDRLNALARAHALTRARSSTDDYLDVPTTTLHSIIQTILAPYCGSGDETKRQFTIDGPDVPVSGKVTTPVSLLLYEIATNAAKHGGLSTPTGRIDIECAKEDNRCLLVWRESGASAMASDMMEGFGNKLIAGTTQQLRADLSKEWTSGGLIVRLCIPLDSLAPPDSREGGGNPSPGRSG
ncbi:PAS domain S-box protein [Pararhizobium sp. YC-54]|uniref:sensor histidine kinase n=1 Tax=Pararhizobium sp. YC-54 TaxID=2986920 RepID=UPI0021F69F9E|nr:PAS domain S-box protein [Pararhizobium sp. YC-54]MCW0000132.1 PAS domain S-box protein [Pararhizobium sp. YC-54]